MGGEIMKRILIIEDDSIITKIYRHKYEEAGYDVASAADGEGGLKKLQDFKPDLVQLDLMVPKINGVEIIKKIRAHQEFNSLPIIVLSNGYMTDMVNEAIKAGANRYVSKMKCSPNLMLAVVNELLNPPAPSPGEIPRSNPAGSASPGKSTPTALPSVEAPQKRVTQGSEGERTLPGIRQEFLERAPGIREDLRSRFHLFVRSHNDPGQLSQSHELWQAVHSLAGFAGMAGFVRISHIANVLEALLKELHSKPKQITSSTLRTVANAMDALGFLFKEVSFLQDEFPQAALILAVDDEPISRIALRTALDKANLRAITLDAPDLALRVLTQNRFDLIFLDVDMPGMNGFELCERIRDSVTNKMTPVVFVTALSDFEGPARSTLTGGNEVIAKPFLPVELALKALTLIVKATCTAKTVAPSPILQAGDSTPEWNGRKMAVTDKK
jgi:DNA-binding response OmpR family regulator